MVQKRSGVALGRLLRLAVLVCVVCLSAVRASAAKPVVCVATPDGDAATHVVTGIPMSPGSKYVLTGGAEYEGKDFYYLSLPSEGEPFQMKYAGQAFGCFVYVADTEDDSLFYSVDAPTIGASYTMVGYNEDLEATTTVVTVIDVNSQENSSGGYAMAISGQSNGILPPAAIEANGKLIGIWAGDWAISFAPATNSSNSNSSDSGSTGGSDSSSDSGSSNGGSTGGSSGSSQVSGTYGGGTTIRRRSSGAAWQTIALVIGGVAAVAAVAALCWVKLAKKSAARNDIVPAPAPERDPAPTPPIAPVGPEPPLGQRPASGSVDLYLEASGGSLSGLQYPIPDSGLLIGRAAEANVRYAADTKGVSRNHCRVFWHNGSIQLMDLGSTSGTYLSDCGRITPNVPVALKEGSVIYLGSKTISLRLCARAKEEHRK